MTIEQYLRTPESLRPHELAYGVLRVADAPAPSHQRAVLHLCRALDDHATGHALGEVWLSPIDVILDPERHLVVQPDLLFISHARGGIVQDRIRGAPDLMVEILSPRPRIGTLHEHVEWFATSGVGECWVVDLRARCVEVIAFGGGAVLDRQVFAAQAPIRSRVLPGFTGRLAGILGHQP